MTSVANRIKIEKRVARHLIRTMVKHNWLPSKVDDGEEVHKTLTEKAVMKAVFAVDEATIIFDNKDIGKKHSVYLVMGNDGWDLIADYGYSDNDDFRSIMENEIDPFTDKICEANF